ncbi:hypothetical protein [Pontibacillus yanchengensis]|uniref:Uncharacterized protein n=1 Tax=Pontibacillus yanchengensis Y32 TaxID=1385514 RepID=A0A0A2TJU1_9BACI|nr:hypothetical protein [Pontibacillus yanchengensis]KGP74708.1 hypothetical protein N782_00745 [Pontibacillus yanchengensis Y32]
MKKTVSIILSIAALIFILANIPNIVAHVKLYSFNANKQVTTETKVLTFDKAFETLYQQRELAQRLEDSTKYSLIGEQVRKGIDDASDYEIFLRKHSQINSIKVELPISTYKDADRTIEFISGKGEVLEISENGQWKKFNGSWDDLWNDLIEQYNQNDN